MIATSSTLDQKSTKPLQILTVCTGNICRSPMTERLLQAKLDQLRYGAFDVCSAGTAAVVGAPIESRIADLIKRNDADERNFVARQLTLDMAHTADIILTHTRAHRSSVVELMPSAVGKTFTLLEFARLVRQSGTAVLSSPVTDIPEAHRKLIRTRHANTLDPALDDVVDPYRQADDILARSAAQILDAVTEVEHWFRDCLKKFH